MHLVALGDPAVGLFRPTDVPHTVLPGPTKAGSTLEQRVFAAIDTLAGGLAELAGRFDLLHAQDCIAARAAARVRDAGAPVTVVRTVHHVDDFTTQALIDCQRQAIVEPDRVLVVSEQWRGILRDEYGRAAEVVPNGVDLDRFPAPPARVRDELRARSAQGLALTGLARRDRRLAGLAGSCSSPSAGWSRARAACTPSARWPGCGATGSTRCSRWSAATRSRTTPRTGTPRSALLPELGLTLGEDVVLLGTVSERELAGWYHAADALCFPSVKEGWGLACWRRWPPGCR